MTTIPWAPGAQATSNDTGPALVRPIRTNRRPCPVCSTGLDGGPVQFWCDPCRKTVFAADLPETTRPLVPLGRAAS